MKFSQLIAFRYLHASRENRYFSWITLLSILGLGIGVAALIVVLSVFNGFESEIRTRMLASNAHVWATRYPAGLNDPEKWIRMIESNKDYGPKIAAITPFVHAETMAKNNSALQGVIIRGVIPKRQEKVQSIINLVKPQTALNVLQKEVDDKAAGKEDPEIPSIVMGSGLANTLNTKVGAVVRLIDPANSGFSTSLPFKVIGIYDSGLKNFDDRLVVMSITTAQKFAGMGAKVTGLSFGLKDPEISTALAYDMGRTYDKLNFKEWKSINNRFFEVMAAERLRVGFIVALVGLVAGFNILTTVFVSVSQRQRDISILKALGATNSDVMRVFLIQSTSIGVVGSLFGVILAGIISYILATYPFLDLPDPYFLKTLPVSYSWSVYGGVCLIASCICWGAGLYPAFIASRVNPTDGMRGTGDAL
ncbi:MAG: ABC transporter permease [Proteobacteria bacterium]|nr:MAG: ABC transporter permease [Pseudomonadota bacterium]